MTEQELEVLRLKLQILVLQELVRMLYSGLANTSPAVAQTLRDQFAKLRKKHAQVALKNVPPEYSDMLAAEYQTALEDLLSLVESGFRKA